jgi:hypothetical protein
MVEARSQKVNQMGDKSPKAKARQKKQEMRQKNEKKAATAAKVVPRPNETETAPKGT